MDQSENFRNLETKMRPKELVDRIRPESEKLEKSKAQFAERAQAGHPKKWVMVDGQYVRAAGTTQQSVSAAQGSASAAVVASSDNV